MKITRNILLLSASTLLIISCGKERLPRVLTDYEESDVELKASASLPEDWVPMTKAVSDITDIDNAGLQSKGFGVYAFYTGDEEYSSTKASTEYSKFGLVLNNRKFQYNDPNWTNTGDAEFWPTFAGENLSLFAYAPWDEWHEKVQYNNDGKVPYIVYDNYVAQSLTESELSKQRDILWGTNTSGNPHKNVEKDDYDPEGIVDFHFRHAVAKVHFNVKGTLPGETRNQVTSGTANTEEGAWGASENGETTSEITLQTKVPQGYNGNNPRYYYARETETETESYVQTRYRTNTVTVTGAQYTTQGFRYLVEEATFKGFNKTGTLILDNSTAYYPTWTNVTRFGGTDPEYVLNSSNVLSQSLRYVDAATVQSNFGTYTGIEEDPVGMMSGYFLYAIPRESSDGDRIAATIKYHRLNVDGNLTVNQKREVIEVQTRTVSRTRTRYRDSQTIRVDRYWGEYYPSEDINDYTFTADFGAWSGWSSWTNSTWSSAAEYSAGEWNITSETLTSATVNYNDDPAPELSGVVMTSLQGGREYDINLIVAGDKIELEVVPKPWELYDFDFDYNANINDVIQSLTYDSSFIDYADAAGNVYINNRMGKFYFKLGTGKYASWQASLVGDAAFGFTDENGEFLLDGNGNRVSSIRGAIDPEVMNYIYIKPVNTESEVTGRAKLRIYLIDATGDAVVALNLVNQLGVTEWTIVQNAN